LPCPPRSGLVQGLVIRHSYDFPNLATHLQWAGRHF
jgi:hypothetical protein